MFLQALYSVKKKEGKIVDLSLLTEDEKLALLELYKTAYEKNAAAAGEKMNEGVNSEVISENDVTALNSDKAEEVSEAENKDTDTFDEIEITYEDDFNNLSDTAGKVSDVSDYRQYTDDVILENGEKGKRTDAFEYTSFTPYKPRYEDIDLNNDFFDMNTDMGIKVKVTKDSNSEKYNMKTKNRRSNVKVSRNGAYTIADSYSATKSKKEIPYLKIATVIFSVLCLVCYVTQFLYNYEQVNFVDYLSDFCFTIAILLIFISVITNSNVVNSLKGIALFVSFGMHFIFFGVSGYQDGLYRILNQKTDYDLMYGIVVIVYLLILYVFILMCAVCSMIGRKGVAKAMIFIGILLVAAAFVMMRYAYVAGTIVVFYNILPEYTAVALFAVAATLSCNIKQK